MPRITTKAGDPDAMPQPIYDAYSAFIKALWRHGRLEAPLREMLRMRSAQLADCRH